MRPRIVGRLDETDYDEAFENTQDGWNAAWGRWSTLSAMTGEAGTLTFEFCGHDETPVKPCSLVSRKIWGKGIGQNLRPDRT